MTTNTPNIALVKYDTVADVNATFNVDTVLNGNWDKIDTAIGANNTAISGLQSKLSSPLTKTANYSINNLEWVLVDSTSTAVNITLPSTGKIRISWSAGTNAVTIIGNVNGATNYAFRTLNDTLDLESVSAGVWRMV